MTNQDVHTAAGPGLTWGQTERQERGLMTCDTVERWYRVLVFRWMLMSSRKNSWSDVTWLISHLSHSLKINNVWWSVVLSVTVKLDHFLFDPPTHCVYESGRSAGVGLTCMNWQIDPMLSIKNLSNDHINKGDNRCCWTSPDVNPLKQWHTHTADPDITEWWCVHLQLSPTGQLIHTMVAGPMTGAAFWGWTDGQTVTMGTHHSCSSAPLTSCQ